MATLNTTPDSFSDGGDHYGLSSAMTYAQGAAESGADMIDIGGYSTRPGSGFISAEEETKRTVTAIRQIREHERSQGQAWTPISIDTFRAEVAEAAIEAGANCINDVYALTGPHEGVAGVTSTDLHYSARDPRVGVSDNDEMLKAAARLGVPVILMHSRGPADKNKDYSEYASQSTYPEHPPVLEGVRKELAARVNRALRAGVRRWNIILDPGIGFSKSVEANLALMANHKLLTAERRMSHIAVAQLHLPPVLNFDPELHDPFEPELTGYPTLVGTSRKAYLGAITERTNPKEREWATAAAVAAAVQQHADIIRVHRVDAHRDVVKVADALWR